MREPQTQIEVIYASPLPAETGARVVAQDWRSAATAHAIRSATRLDIASEVTSIIAAGFAIVVVRTLTNRQSERAQANRAAVAAPITE